MNRTVRLLLLGLAIVVILVLGWFFVLNPIRGDIDSASAQIDEARASLSVAQAKLAQAEATRQEGEKNQARLIELSKMVPSSPEIGSLLVQVQDLASQAGIEFMSITPAEPLEFADFRVIPMAVEFTGTYFDLSDFILQGGADGRGPR